MEAPKQDNTTVAGYVVLGVAVVLQYALTNPADASDAGAALFSMLFCGGPFYLVAFILGVIAMTRGERLGGILVILGSLALPILVAGAGVAFKGY